MLRATIALGHRYRGPLILRATSAAAARGGRDGHGEADTDEELVPGGVEDPDYDADHLSITVEQRSARISRVDCRVNLDQAFDGVVGAGGLERAVKARDDAGAERAVQPKRIADSVGLIANVQGVRVAHNRGNHELGQLIGLE